MFAEQKNWHWAYKKNEYDFVDDNTKFAIVRYHHKMAEELPLHSHGFTEMVYIVKGKATHLFQCANQSEYRTIVKEGDIFIINPYEQHTYIFDQGEDMEIININFESAMISNYLNMQDDSLDYWYQQPYLPLEIRFGNIITIDANSRERNIIQIMFDEFASKQPGYDIVSKLALCQLLVLLGRKYEKIKYDINSAWMKNYSDILRVKGYIENHYNEDLSKETLSRLAFCSERHLSRKFKELTHMTVFEYINKFRIEQAKRLLAETGLNITVISTKVGFANVSYFNRLFVKYVKITPREFRNQCREATLP